MLLLQEQFYIQNIKINENQLSLSDIIDYLSIDLNKSNNSQNFLSLSINLKPILHCQKIVNIPKNALPYPRVLNYLKSRAESHSKLSTNCWKNELEICLYHSQLTLLMRE